VENPENIFPLCGKISLFFPRRGKTFSTPWKTPGPILHSSFFIFNCQEGIMPFLTDTPDGAVLSLRIVPRAAKNAIQGEHGDALKIRLCAPPVDGAANAALIEFLSDTLSLPRARIQLLGGKTSRTKRVLLAGLSASAIRTKIQAGTQGRDKNT